MAQLVTDDGSARLNVLKAGFAALVVVCVTVLLATGRVVGEAGFGLIGTICGYVLANGVNAKLGRTPAPLIEPKPAVELPEPSGWKPDPGPE